MPLNIIFIMLIQRKGNCLDFAGQSKLFKIIKERLPKNMYNSDRGQSFYNSEQVS